MLKMLRARRLFSSVYGAADGLKGVFPPTENAVLLDSVPHQEFPLPWQVAGGLLPGFENLLFNKEILFYSALVEQ